MTGGIGSPRKGEGFLRKYDAGTKLTGGKVVANCLLPEEYEGKQGWVTCDFQNGYPEGVKERVLERWERLGLE